MVIFCFLNVGLYRPVLSIYVHYCRVQQDFESNTPTQPKKIILLSVR